MRSSFVPSASLSIGALASMASLAALSTFFSFTNFVPVASAQAPSNPVAKGTFFSKISATPKNLFPITSSDGEADRPISNMLFESLLDRHWDTYEWMPMIASKWEISTDGKEFTFDLNPNAKFWDGSKITAEDVKFSFDIIFMKGVDSTALKPYYEQVEKLEILSPTKVRFKVKELYFKNFDVCAGLTIFSKKHYEALYKKDNTLAKYEVTSKPLGSSQWKIERIDDNQQVILQLNANYWNKDELIKRGEWNYDRYIFKVIPEEAVSFEAFKKGDLTYMGLSPKQWEKQSSGPEFGTRLVKVQTKNKQAKGFSYIAWNQLNPITANKDVRWALAHLADLQKWIQKLDYNLTEPTIGPFSPKMDEHNPALSAITFSLKEARKRLAAAGWTTAGKDGFLVKDGKRFELSIIYAVQGKESWEPKLADFKNQAAKVGIDIQLKSLEWTSFIKLMDDKKFDGIALGWDRGLDGDPKQIWHSASIANNGSNFISYKNPEVDKLIDTFRATLERPKRIEIGRQIQTLIFNDQPYTFLTEGKFSLYSHQKYVKKEKDSYNYAVGTGFWRLQQ